MDVILYCLFPGKKKHLSCLMFISDLEEVMEDAQIADDSQQSVCWRLLIQRDLHTGQHQPYEIQQGETWSPVVGVTDFSALFLQFSCAFSSPVFLDAFP